MLPSYCSHCGGPVPAGAVFCPACGATVTPTAAGGVATPLPAAPPPVGAWPVPYPPPGWGGSSSPNAGRERAGDLKALRAVRLASVLGLVGGIAGLVAASLLSSTSVLAVTTTSGGTSVSAQLPAMLGVIFGIAAAFGLVQLILYRTGFHTLSEVSAEFSTPSTLALLALLGGLFLVAGAGLFLVAFYQAIQCAGAGNPLTAACLVNGTFWSAVALIALGGILALVGYIGILVGIWRLGSRFHNALFKVGAILLIIPYLSVVGQILLLVGTTQEIGRG